jgi:hypothetical protein
MSWILLDMHFSQAYKRSGNRDKVIMMRHRIIKSDKVNVDG